MKWVNACGDIQSLPDEQNNYSLRLEGSVCDPIDQPTHNGGKSHGTYQTKGRVGRRVSCRG